MKPEARDYLRSRLTGLKRELCYLQEKWQQVATDPSRDTERQAIDIRYYDAIIRWLLEGVERLEADLRCAGGSP
jgi:hypothetical protein